MQHKPKPSRMEGWAARWDSKQRPSKRFCQSASLLAGLALASTAASAATFVPGYLTYEYYPGSDRPTVEAGTAGTPSTAGSVVGSDKSGYINKLETGTNISDNYANRVFGYFIPPATGDYVFFVAGDDDTDLYLSTDATAANKHLIAQEAGYSGVRSYLTIGGTSLPEDKRSDTFSLTEWPEAGTIHLLANQKYFIEAVHHDGTGGDNLAVTYKLVSEPDPQNGAAPRLTGAVIGTDFTGTIADPALSITTQPTGGTFYVGASVSLSAAAQTDSPFPVTYQWRKNGTAIPGATGPNYTIPAPTVGDTGNYDVQVSVPGTTGAPKVVTSSAANVTVQDSPFVEGFLKYDYFPGLDRPTVEGGGADPSYDGNTVGADKSGYIDNFESADGFADNYANRISGLFIPPTSGNYVFYIYADDDADLFLSTDDKPANKKLIAQEAGWSNSRAWNTIGGTSIPEDKRSDSFANTQWPNGNTIALTAGQKYYIEAVHHEGGGGDRLGVTYRLDTEDEALTADGTASRLTGSVVGVNVPPPQSLDITNQPANASVYAGTPALFNVGATTDSHFSIQYQWRKNGVDIPNATESHYSFVTVPGDNGAKYDVVLTLPSLSTTSTVATVTVKSGTITVNGKLKQEYFSGETGDDIKNGTLGAPSFVRELSSFETPVNYADNYAERVSGYFIPATTGNYVFFISSDDDSDLYLSTDDSPTNKRLIAHETAWSNNREWTISGGGSDLAQKRSDQFSPDGGLTTPYASGIPLTAGQKYYIEGVHHEGGGGDDFGVTFKLISDPDPTSADSANGIAGDPSALTGNLIAYATSPVSTGSITAQPQDVSQYEAQAANLSVTVNTDSELTPLYQWRKGGTAVPGATNRVYSFPFLALTDSGSYDVVVTIPNGQTLTSSAADLQVLGAPLITGLVKYDYFPGQTRAAVEAGTAGDPSTAGYLVGGDQSGYITIFESALGFADSYANRISGYFIPPTTDDYVFFINSDDDSDLFLSADDSPANKKLIAQEAGWSNYRSWNNIGATSVPEDKRSDYFANTQWPGGNNIHLTAGKLYYIEAVHTEGGGGDNLGVTYKIASNSDPEDLSASTLKGSVIGVKVIPQPLGTTPPTITSAVASASGITLTFSAPLDHTSASATANYSLGTGVTVNSATVKDIFQGANIVSVVTLKTTGATACTEYSIAVSNVKDAVGNMIAPSTTVPVTTPCLTLDFNTDTLPAGITLGDLAAIVPGLGPDGSGALQLTENVGSQQGAIRIDNIGDGHAVTNFTVAFKLFIGNGTANPADGMSLSFGNIPSDVLSVGEEGTGAISVNFDIYNNGNTGPGGRPEAPAFEVKVNGSIVGWIPLSGSAIVNDQWVDVVISLNSDNSITTIYNGITYFNHLPISMPTDLVSGSAVTGYTPVTGGTILIGGRTGGENARQAIEDLTLVVNSSGEIVTPPGGDTRLTATVSGNMLSISWTPQGGTLESSPVLGPNAAWTAVGTQNPASVAIDSNSRFFRVRQ